MRDHLKQLISTADIASAETFHQCLTPCGGIGKGAIIHDLLSFSAHGRDHLIEDCIL